VKAQSHRDIEQKELKALIRFSALINSSLQIEDVLNFAMESAEQFMHAEASSIYEVDPERGDLFIRIARGEKKEPVKGIRLKWGQGIAGRVVESKKPMVVQDVSKEKAFSPEVDRKTGFTTRSMVCVPLILRGEAVGAVQVLNKRDQEPFTSSDLELLTTMSQQIAVALENAKLYERLQEQFRLTEQELRVTQERLIRSERLAATGNLIQGVAHEVRNPIMTIGGFALRIKKALKDHRKIQEYADIILQESQRLENLVREVQEFADIQSPTLKRGNISEVLQRVLKKVEALARELAVRLFVDIQEDLPPTMLDDSQLFKAFSNILENALEAMPEGGTLTIEALSANGHIRIKIVDTGCGVSKEALACIYDPFFTSKTHGAGLGLTMVHQIMMNHHGEIKIQSGQGIGTTVTLQIPVSP